jgi:hypothetical protein
MIKRSPEEFSEEDSLKIKTAEILFSISKNFAQAIIYSNLEN